MDKQLADHVNQQLGNLPGSPILEMTMLCPQIRLSEAAWICLSPGTELFIDGAMADSGKPVQVSGGSTISFGRVEQGCRAYFGVAGSWQLSSWLGRTGAITGVTEVLHPAAHISEGSVIRIDQDPEPVLGERHIAYETGPVRFMKGPEYHVHGLDAATMIARTFKVSTEMNRMGMRLEGTIDELSGSVRMASSAVVPGTIQLTPSGQLIITLNDGQTTGGYPRIGNVLSEDLDKLGRLKPGDELDLALFKSGEAFTK